MSSEWRNDQGLCNAFIESPRLIKLLPLVLDSEPLPYRKVWNVYWKISVRMYFPKQECSLNP